MQLGGRHTIRKQDATGRAGAWQPIRVNQ